MPLLANAELPNLLLDWYDRHRRVLPWRAAPGEPADPYRVWLSEIMLQQTTVAAVKSYYATFLARWPTVRDLATAPVEDVMAAWAGLGYYARARNLHRCAVEVASKHGGQFPDNVAGLRTLPGVGAYTAAAIAAIAFGRQATVVDGNVERVMARLFACAQPLPAAKKRLHELAHSLTQAARPGDYAQAVMDLGATICTPRAPKCLLCPWRGACRAFAAGKADSYPRKTKAPAKPTRHAVAYFVTRGDGAIWLRRRSPDGLLGGMHEVPTGAWRDGKLPARPKRDGAPRGLRFRALPGSVRHGFTHFDFEIQVCVARADSRSAKSLAGEWWALDRIGEAALPSAMLKIVRHALRRGSAD
jgi:A/G-specific adenine glycosylase